jgi:hypothetical protein
VIVLDDDEPVWQRPADELADVRELARAVLNRALLDAQAERGLRRVRARAWLSRETPEDDRKH